MPSTNKATPLSIADALLDLFPEAVDVAGEWHDALAGAFGGDGDELDSPVASAVGLLCVRAIVQAQALCEICPDKADEVRMAVAAQCAVWFFG